GRSRAARPGPRATRSRRSPPTRRTAAGRGADTRAGPTLRSPCRAPPRPWPREWGSAQGTRRTPRRRAAPASGAASPLTPGSPSGRASAATGDRVDRAPRTSARASLTDRDRDERALRRLAPGGRLRHDDVLLARTGVDEGLLHAEAGTGQSRLRRCLGLTQIGRAAVR